MTGSAPAPQSRALARIADEYRAKGFAVVVEPRPDALPPALSQHRPDLLATKDGTTYVIELVGPGPERSPRSSKKLGELAQAVAQLPGWHLRVLLPSGENGNASTREVASEETIQKQLRDVETLLRASQNDAALLLAWAAFEAAARYLLASEGFDPSQPLSPTGVVKALIQHGYVPQDAAARLQSAMAARNEIAHGYFARSVSPEEVRELVELAFEALSFDDVRDT